MIQIKKLSGEYITIETDADLNVEALREMMPSPFPIFFLNETQLQIGDIVPKDCELCVVFQSYRTYFIWSGGNNSVWPGDHDKTYCIDCSSREYVEWSPSMITENDVVVCDYLSFGLYSPYNEMIKDTLDITFMPLDMDREEIFSVLDNWRDRAVREADNTNLTVKELVVKYSEFPVNFNKYPILFRDTDNYCRTALEWIKRVTE
jgi:hypothetical protein